MDESPMISPNDTAATVSPPPSEGPGPLIFGGHEHEHQSEHERERSPSMLSDEMRRTPSPMNTSDTKIY